MGGYNGVLYKRWEKGKLYFFSKLGRFFHIVGSGDEGFVFKEGDRVLKIHNPIPLKSVLDEDTAVKLTKLNTQRVLLPGKENDSLLFDGDGNFVAYKSKYVKNLRIRNLLNLDSQRLKEEATLLKEDVLMLSNANILMDDLLFQNFVFHYGIYLVDVGSFRFIFDDVLSIYQQNMKELDRGLMEIMYYADRVLESDSWASIRKISQIYSYYLDSGYMNVVDFMNEEIKEDSLEKYLIKIK